MPFDESFAQCVNRGCSERLILIAGWGFSGDVFDSLKLRCNYLIVDDVGDFVDDPERFTAALAEALDACGDPRAHVLGWSLGAHAALAWANAFPHRVRSLHLVSVRPRFSIGEIEREKQALAADAAAHLERFYRRAFVSDAAVRANFDLAAATTRALRPLAEGTSPSKRLEKQLDYLASSTLEPARLDDPRAILWHGQRDRIAPYAEAAALAEAAECELYRFERGGHAIVFTPEFEQRWSEWLVQRSDSSD